jgi:CRISPR/Cas system CSM-associated protein Csm2 small subunit
MALSTDTRAAIAFKRALGLANAQTANPFFSEVIPTQFSIAASEVIGEEINENPTSAANVQKVTCELQEAPGDGFASGFGYNIVLQQGETVSFYNTAVTVDDGNSGGSPENRKLRRFRTSSGQFFSARAVPQKFNRTLSTAVSPGYGYDLFDPLVGGDPDDAGSVRIPRTSAAEWQVDPFSGTLVAENALNLNTGNAAIILYLYTGPTVQDVIDDGLSGGGGGVANVAAGPGLDVTNFNASTGEATLAVSLDEVVSNVANDTTNGINFNYNGSTRVGTFSLNTTFLDNDYLRNDGDTATGSYNFNAGVFQVNASNVTAAAQNIQLNSDGTLSVDGDINATDPNASGLGSITCVELTEISSARYKENISEMDSVLDRLDRVRPVSYRNKGRDGEEIGFIAEEMDEVFPEVVSKDAEGRPDSINYGRLTPVIFQMLKEVRDENRQLRDEIGRLKG